MFPRIYAPVITFRQIVLKADKGNKTVIMEKSEYSSKMLALLNDNKTYKLVNRDPTTSIQTTNNELARTWLIHY